MKNLKFVCAIAGIMAMATPQVILAEDKKPEGLPNREELREKFQNLSPEEREAKRKEFMEKRGEEMKKAAKDLGLDPEELKKLSPEERRAKVKEAADKKITELQKKKTDGTITDSEKETLKKMEQRRKWAEERFGSGNGGEKSDTKKKSDK